MADPFGPPPLQRIPPLGDAHRQPPHGRSSPHRSPAHSPPPAHERSPDDDDLAVILGIPTDQLTQPVHDALVRLIGDAGRLRDELSHRTAREEYLDLLAHRCELTNLLNRRGLARELGRVTARLEPDGSGGTLVLFHLAGLEALRRSHGIAAADAARRHAATVLSIELRLSDLVAALGGGDFAACLVLTHGEEAEAKAAALAERLNSPPFHWQDRPYPFTIALGLAVIRPDSSLPALLADANAGLHPV